MGHHVASWQQLSARPSRPVTAHAVEQFVGTASASALASGPFTARAQQHEATRSRPSTSHARGEQLVATDSSAGASHRALIAQGAPAVDVVAAWLNEHGWVYESKSTRELIFQMNASNGTWTVHVRVDETAVRRAAAAV